MGANRLEELAVLVPQQTSANLLKTQLFFDRENTIEGCEWYSLQEKAKEGLKRSAWDVIRKVLLCEMALYAADLHGIWGILGETDYEKAHASMQSIYRKHPAKSGLSVMGKISSDYVADFKGFLLAIDPKRTPQSNGHLMFPSSSVKYCIMDEDIKFKDPEKNFRAGYAFNPVVLYVDIESQSSISHAKGLIGKLKNEAIVSGADVLADINGRKAEDWIKGLKIVY